MATHFGFADISVWFTHSTDPRPAAITFGVASDGKDANQVWSAVLGALGQTGSILTKMPTTVKVSRIRVSYGTDGDEDEVYDMPAAAAGTTALSQLPPNCAVLVHKRTQRGGRRGRGRIFLPWFGGETKVNDNGTLDSAELVAMNTCVNAFYTDLSARGVPMFLLHQPGLSAPGLPTAVTSLAVDPVISSQRRRLHR